MEQALLLAIHADSYSVHHLESIPCNKMAAKQKLSAEGALEEQKIILGWFFNFQHLTVALLENKFIAWAENIHSILLTSKTTPHELKQLIG
jgi:hypothetical protein